MDVKQIRSLSPEERRGHKFNQRMKTLEKQSQDLSQHSKNCDERVALAEIERDKAEQALRSLMTEFARVRDRLKRAEAHLRSLGERVED